MSEGKKLTVKQELFCRYYCWCANIREAAYKAGYSESPEKNGIELLLREDIRGRIKEIDNQLNELENVCKMGWRKLAVGNISDVIKLLYHQDENPPENLDGMDFSCVSEIKKPKGGGMEVKFFDRLRALEKLQLYAREKDEVHENSFFSALEKGARALDENAGAGNE